MQVSCARTRSHCYPRRFRRRARARPPSRAGACRAGKPPGISCLGSSKPSRGETTRAYPRFWSCGFFISIACRAATHRRPPQSGPLRRCVAEHRSRQDCASGESIRVRTQPRIRPPMHPLTHLPTHAQPRVRMRDTPSSNPLVDGPVASLVQSPPGSFVPRDNSVSAVCRHCLCDVTGAEGMCTRKCFEAAVRRAVSSAPNMGAC